MEKNTSIQPNDKSHEALSLINSCGNIIRPNSSCNILLTPQVSGGDHDEFIIVRAQNESSQPIVIRQMVQLSEHLPDYNGYKAKLVNDEIITDKNGNYSVAIPYLLTKDIPKPQSDNINCLYGSNKGDTCVIYIDNKTAAASTVETTSILATKTIPMPTPIADNSNDAIKVELTIRAPAGPRLLMSYATTVTAGSNSTLSIFNQGGAPAENVTFRFLGASSVKIQNPTVCQTIASQAECKLTLNLKDDTKYNGSTMLEAKIGETRVNSAVVLFSVTKSQPKISLSANSDTINASIGNTISSIITLKNDSPHNFIISSINDSNNADWIKEANGNNVCVINKTIASGSSCILQYKYTPTISQSKQNFLIAVNGTALDENKIQRGYRLATNINYSAKQDIAETITLAIPYYVELTKDYAVYDNKPLWTGFLLLSSDNVKSNQNILFGLDKPDNGLQYAGSNTGASTFQVNVKDDSNRVFPITIEAYKLCGGYKYPMNDTVCSKARNDKKGDGQLHMQILTTPSDLVKGNYTGEFMLVAQSTTKDQGTGQPITDGTLHKFIRVKIDLKVAEVISWKDLTKPITTQEYAKCNNGACNQAGFFLITNDKVKTSENDISFKKGSTLVGATEDKPSNFSVELLDTNSNNQRNQPFIAYKICSNKNWPMNDGSCRDNTESYGTLIIKTEELLPSGNYTREFWLVEQNKHNDTTNSPIRNLIRVEINYRVEIPTLTSLVWWARPSINGCRKYELISTAPTLISISKDYKNCYGNTYVNLCIPSPLGKFKIKFADSRRLKDSNDSYLLSKFDNANECGNQNVATLYSIAISELQIGKHDLQVTAKVNNSEIIVKTLTIDVAAPLPKEPTGDDPKIFVETCWLDNWWTKHVACHIYYYGRDDPNDYVTIESIRVGDDNEILLNTRVNKGGSHIKTVRFLYGSRNRGRDVRIIYSKNGTQFMKTAPNLQLSEKPR